MTALGILAGVAALLAVAAWRTRLAHEVGRNRDRARRIAAARRAAAEQAADQREQLMPIEYVRLLPTRRRRPGRAA